MAPKVLFHILETRDDAARLRYACGLVEELVREGGTACIRVASTADAATLDDLLWTHAERSFIPHDVSLDPSARTGPPPASPVLITVGFSLPAATMINLGAELPEPFDDYAQLIEIIDAEPTRRDAGRRRFAAYRDRGHPPETHRVT
jgi:DNA polymerase III subunit chi